MYVFIYLFIYLFIDLFIYLFIVSFTYLFIYAHLCLYSLYMYIVTFPLFLKMTAKCVFFF